MLCVIFLGYFDAPPRKPFMSLPVGLWNVLRPNSGKRANIYSNISAQNNGGILENEIEVDGVVEQRYWIELF